MGQPTIEAIKVWRINTPRHLPMLLSHTVMRIWSHSFPYPTQQCAMMPGDAPRFTTSRAWSTSAFGRDKGVDEHGGRWDSCRYIIEVMSQDWDDGHMEFVLSGYALLTMKQMDAWATLMRAVREPNHVPIVVQAGAVIDMGD